MSPAHHQHDQQWREQTLSTHRQHGRYCAACGQSWECDPYVRAGMAVGVLVGLLALFGYAMYALMHLAVEL